MRIVFVTAYFIGNSKGGTEVYTFNLAKSLIENGFEVVFITIGNKRLNFYYEGIPIHQLDEKELMENDAVFRSILSEINPTIYHQHTLTPAFNEWHMAVAKSLGISTFFSCHIASVTCINGGMLLFGKAPCDGEILESRCTACYINSKGKSRFESNLIAKVISTVNIFNKSESWPNVAFNVARIKKRRFNLLNTNCDAFFVFTDWQVNALLNNKVRESKIIKYRHATLEINNLKNYELKDSGKIVIGFTGRLTQSKGLHILLKAIKSIGAENISIIIFAISVQEEMDYYKYLLELSNGLDIKWVIDDVNYNNNNFFNSIELLCVPSIVMETGPLVIHESFAHKVPVLGANIGGIAELIINNWNGFLFENEDHQDLIQKLLILIKDKSLLVNFSKQINQSRSYSLIAHEVMESYKIHADAS